MCRRFYFTGEEPASLLKESPTSARGTEEAESVAPESLTKDQDEKSSENGNWWSKNQNMDNLTEQMGQLASESNP